jgi:hypothetical protein
MALCNISKSLLRVNHGCDLSRERETAADDMFDWAEAHVNLQENLDDQT